DMIVQNISAATTGLTDISFTLPRADGEVAMAALRAVQADIGFETLLYDDRIGKVSLIGAGMRSHPGVSATFFTALAEAGVNIEMISTSEIRISVVVDERAVDAAVTAAHKAFDLDAGEVEAVGYGGTGRGAAAQPWPWSGRPARSGPSCSTCCPPAATCGETSAGRLTPLGRAPAAGPRPPDRGGCPRRGRVRRRGRGHVRRAGRGLRPVGAGRGGAGRRGGGALGRVPEASRCPARGPRGPPAAG